MEIQYFLWDKNHISKVIYRDFWPQEARDPINVALMAAVLTTAPVSRQPLLCLLVSNGSLSKPRSNNCAVESSFVSVNV
jgi:hypothetical protein